MGYWCLRALLHVSRSGPYIGGSLLNICSPSLQLGSPAGPNGILVDWFVSRVVNMGHVNAVAEQEGPGLVALSD